jgi:biopolymer transport protein ExbD
MEEKGFDHVNIIPLVDVMMVLLTIVLMTSTFIASGAIPVELPKITENQKAALKTVTITIDRQGTVYFESVAVSADALRERVGVLARDVPVLVKADRQVTVQACVDVLDLLSGKGFKKVGLQTERGQ